MTATLRCSVTSWDPESGRPSTRTATPEEAVAALGDDQALTWVDVLAPTAEELAGFGEHLGIHRLEVEDATEPGERPKASRHEEHSSFVVYALTPRSDVADAIASDTARRRAVEPAPDGPEGDAVAPTRPGEPSAIDEVLEGEARAGSFGHALFHHTRVSGFVFVHGLLTVRSDDRLAPDALLARWAQAGHVARMGTHALVQGLLDVVVDGYAEAAQFLDDRIEDLEDDLFAPEGRLEGFQRRAYALRKELVELRRVVLPMSDVLGVLWRRRPAGEGTTPHLDALFADLTDHVLRVTEWTDSLRDMIATVFETHLSLQDQRLNQIMKKLAGWAAVISVPTLVTSWFGMNVPYPGNGKPLGLVVAALCVLVPASIMWWTMRRRDWL